MAPILYRLLIYREEQAEKSKRLTSPCRSHGNININEFFLCGGKAAEEMLLSPQLRPGEIRITELYDAERIHGGGIHSPVCAFQC